MINPEVVNQLKTNKEPTRVAVIDLGTNTFHLLIADIKAEDKPQVVFQETIAVKLGEGGIAQGTISRDAFTRGVNALKIFKEHIEHHRAVSVMTAATSAIRSAVNRKEFIDEIKSETGLAVQVIDGDREAELIYQGVRAAVTMDTISLIVDIGGGSVEFIICDKNRIFWKKSYPIGAARLFEKFHYHDPIPATAIRELQDYLDINLEDLHYQLRKYNPGLMIGSAGSFETFAALQDNKRKVTFERPEKKIDLEVFNRISEQLIKTTHAERAVMPAIPAVRVDMIVVSTILTNYILKKSGIKKMVLSAYSLKEGVLFEMGK